MWVSQLCCSPPAFHVPQQRCVKNKIPGLAQAHTYPTAVTRLHTKRLEPNSAPGQSPCSGLAVRLCWRDTGASPGCHSNSPSKDHLFGDCCFMIKDRNSFSLGQPLPIPMPAATPWLLPLSVLTLLEDRPLNKALQTQSVKKIAHNPGLLGAQPLSARQLWTAERKTDVVQEGETVFGPLSHHNLCSLTLISLEGLHGSVCSMNSTQQSISYPFGLCCTLHHWVRWIPGC